MSPQEQKRVFLSYNRRHATAVKKVQRLLEDEKVPTFLDADQLKPGLLWPEAVEEALSAASSVLVFLGESGLGPWQKREMYFALERQVQEELLGNLFPVIPVLLDPAASTLGFVFQNTWVDLSASIEDRAKIAEIIEAVQVNKKRSELDVLPKICPYQGLEPFDELNAGFYFGREQFATELFEKIQHTKLITVVGPSGSGKSSVVLAGLMPKLRRQKSPVVWDVVTFKPGNFPWRNLADGFVRLRESISLGQTRSGADLERDFSARRGGLESEITQFLRDSRGTSRLLIIIDQFEELLTLTPEAERGPFIDTLLAASAATPMTLLLTLRADFYGAALQISRNLSDRLPNGQVNLGPMQETEVRASIEEPARQVGLIFDPGLVDRILQDVTGQSGYLPLLEFALQGLWIANKARLTYDSYRKIGGVAGAIASSAESVFNSLTDAQQIAAHRLFTRLVRVSIAGEEGADTRRRARRSEIGDEAWEVAQKFAQRDVRLLITSGTTESGLQPDSDSERQFVEVAHEALIRSWNRLKDWVQQDRDFLLWRQRLGFAISEWERTKRSEAALLRGELLEEAINWLNLRGQDLNDSERGFVTITESPEHQVLQVIAEGERLLRFAETNPVASEWLTVLFLSGREDEALALAKSAAPEISAAVLAALAHVRSSAGDSGRGLEFARQLVDPVARAAALTDIAQVLVADDPKGQLPATVKEAASAIGAIAEREYLRASAISSLLKVAAAGCEIATALEIANQFERAGQGTGLVKRLAGLLIDAGRIDDALQIVSEQQQPDRIELFIELIRSLARNKQFDGIALVATKAAASLAQVADPQSALIELVGTLAAVTAEDQAIEIARQTTDACGKVEALLKVSEVLKQEDRKASAEVAREALVNTSAIANEYSRNSAIAKAVHILVENEALGAAELARSLVDPSDRAQALTEVAAVIGNAKVDEQALATAQEALAAARQVAPGYNRGVAVTSIAVLLAEWGQLSGAIETARSVDAADERARILVELMKTLLRLGEYEGVVTTAGEALSAIGGISEYSRGNAIRDLFEVLFEAELEETALGLARAASAPAERCERLMQLFGCLVKRSNAGDARFAAHEAAEAANEIADDRQRQESLLAVVAAFVEAKILDPVAAIWKYVKKDTDRAKILTTLSSQLISVDSSTARALARQIEVGPERDEAFAVIAQSLVRAGELTLAVETEAEIENQESRRAVLIELFKAFANLGHKDDALQVAEKVLGLSLTIGENWKQRETIGQAMLLFGKLKNAKRATAASLSIPDPIARVTMLFKVARALREDGNDDESATLAREAAQFVPEIIRTNANRVAITEAMQAAAEIGEATVVFDLLSRLDEPEVRPQPVPQSFFKRLWGSSSAEPAPLPLPTPKTPAETAKSIVDERTRAIALGATAIALANSGQSAQALELALLIDAPQARVDTLAKAAHLTTDVDLLLEAVKAARDLQTDFARKQAMGQLIPLLVRTGRTTDALNIAREVSSGTEFGKHLRTILLETDAGQRAQTNAVVSAAIANLDQLEPYSRSSARGDLIAALVKVELGAEALSLARNAESLDERLSAFEAIIKALAEAGRKDQALNVAREARELVLERQDHYHRVSGLLSITSALIRAGMPAEALEGARSVAPEDRSRLLVQSIKVLVDFRRLDLAKVAAGDALAAAREIETDYLRVSYEVVQELADAGLTDEALRRGRDIADADGRLRAHGAIIEALGRNGKVEEAKGVAREALGLAFQAEEEYSRRSLFQLVVSSLIEVDMEETALVFSQDVSDQSIRVETLAALAESFTRKGQLQKAATTAQEAIEVSRSIQTYQRRSSLSALVSGLAAAGSFDRAIEVASQVLDPYDHAAVLADLIEPSLRRHRRKRALQLAEKVLYLMDKIQEDYRRLELAGQLARSLIDANLSDKALEIIERASLGRGRLETLGSFSLELLKKGRTAEALAILQKVPDAAAPIFMDLSRILAETGEVQEALELAGKIRGERRDEAFKAIARLMIERGALGEVGGVTGQIESVNERESVLADLGAAQLKDQKLAEALNTTRALTDQVRKAKLLALVARALVKSGDIQQAESVAAEAEQAALSIMVYDDRGRALARMAVVLADLHHFGRSRVNAKDCHLPKERLWAYTAILRNHLTIKNPNLAGPMASVLTVEL